MCDLVVMLYKYLIIRAYQRRKYYRTLLKIVTAKESVIRIEILAAFLYLKDAACLMYCELGVASHQGTGRFYVIYHYREQSGEIRIIIQTN